MPPDPNLASISEAAGREIREAPNGAPPICVPNDLPPLAQMMTFLGVDYFHLKTADGGDLYLTRYGLPFWQHLQPANWFAREWFEAKRERLEGTSTIYRVPTRAVDDLSLDLVVKWSRVGEVIPMDTFTINKFVNAEFNSPFEEFCLLMELRKGRAGPRGIRIRTQLPLAIYVPSKKLQLWQTGRSEDKINAKVARHPGVEIDILRQYLVLFRWVKGEDAVETAKHFGLDGSEREQFLSLVNSVVVHELAQKGYRVMDMKPAHVILRPQAGHSMLRDRNGQFAYALVDYELLQRTPEHETAVRDATRRSYLRQVAQPFEPDVAHPIPVHLRPTTVLGVDYLYGHAESTGGSLWVVGRNPELFHYFLPERWRRTPKRRLSMRNQVFYTRTKDNINLVWKVSRMGEWPWLGSDTARQHLAWEHGFNHPFEEMALALQLNRCGIKTVYPRAIYRTGNAGGTQPAPFDRRRFEKARDLLTLDGEPTVSPEYDYITIWGFWKRGDETSANDSAREVWAVNALHALRRGFITELQLDRLIEATATRLQENGFQDLNLKPDHLLVSFGRDRNLVLGEAGQPEVRLCNFELFRRVPVAAADATRFPAGSEAIERLHSPHLDPPHEPER